MTPAFSDPNISIAVTEDIPALRKLMNSAYRGEESRKGWTTEAGLIAGDVRTTEEGLLEVMKDPASVLLKYTNDKMEIIGCVNLQQHGNRIYLGMFSVSPLLQGGGIGKKILHASEEYAKQLGCTSIYMTVVSVRDELINWYKRHGYVYTGERKPFEEDGVHGKHLQHLEFMVLEKTPA
jgi:ribosomal protein S18 acetylase RimI-like enzyme